MNNIKFWIKGARIYTLPIGLVPVVMAGVVAIRVVKNSYCFISSTNVFRLIIQFILCIGIALFLQISVNYANDYCDGIKGLDDNRNLRNTVNNDFQKKNKSSLCDVSWKLADAGITRHQVRNAMIICALCGCLCGLIAVVISGLWLFILIGILCLASAWFYAGGKHPYGYYGFGEISAFTFFGPVAFIGTLCIIFYGIGISNHIVINSPLSSFACVAMSFIPGGCSACLMMINNLRDINVDKNHGKLTAMVRIGEKAGQTLCSYVVVMVLVFMTFYAVASLIFPSFMPSVWHFGVNFKDGLIQGFAFNTFRLCLFISQCILQLAVLAIMFIKGISLIRVLHKSDYKRAFPLCVSVSMLTAISTLLSLLSIL